MKGYYGELKWLIRHFRPYLAKVIILSLAGAGLSVLGVSFAYLTKQLIDAATGAAMGRLWTYSVILGILIVFRMGIQSIYSYAHTKVLESAKNHLRGGMFNRIMAAEWSGIAKYHSGDILMRMTTDIDVITRGVVGILPGIVGLVAQLIGALVLVYLMDPMMALIAIVVGPVLLLIFKVMGKKLRNMFLHTRELAGKVRSFVQEIVQNIQVVKSFNLEKHMAGRLDRLHKEHLAWVLRKTVISLVTNIGMGLSYWLAYFLVLVWGSYRLAAGLMGIGTLVAFLQLIGQIQGPFQGLIRVVPQLISTSASASRLMEIDGLTPDLDDGLARDGSGAVPLAMERVHFAYDPGRVVLRNVSLSIQPGEMVALVGASGEGKTTLLKLLLALLKPDQGSIRLFSEHEEYPVGPGTREYFTYVPQEKIIFSGTIAENIRLGDLAAVDSDLVDCLKVASAWDFVSQLPQGLDTEIGENGLGLSQGQAQRVAIARALLRDAPVLLLDEATSALDEATEGEILRSIKASYPTKTCIFVTHRASVAACCDSVYKIQGGCLSPLSINRTELIS